MSFEIRTIIITAIVCIAVACSSWIAVEFGTFPEDTDKKCGTEEVGLFVLGMLLVLSLLGVITCVILLVCNMVWGWW